MTTTSGRPLSSSSTARISTLSAVDLTTRIAEFGALLKACVDDGASVNFIAPFTQGEAETYWREKILPGLEADRRIVLGADIDGRLAGTVNLDIDTPANQVHRGEVSKLLVHPDFRRRGLARALMGEIELQARAHARTLLTLDTLTGDNAEPLYASIGYITAGIIPDYCRNVHEDRLSSTTLMYKKL